MLPADAPQGLCPRCLAALNLATETMPPDALPMAAQAPLTPEELSPHFPQLEILECLGRGGMGVVYKARQKSLNRLVALKLLAPERAGDAQFAIRFAREAQTLATLSHPHIVTIHDFGQAGGFYFLLMEFIDGVNLRQAMKAGRFTPDQALAIVPPVCEALQYAHEHGIVHRDIKPENLLMDKSGRVKIADFGIAKIIDHDEAAEISLNDSRTTAAGTPAYAAPEQQDGKSDHRADIYSLGVVLYELLTGQLPGKSLTPPSQRVQIDVRLDEVVLRALETRPELRYATAAEFRTRLEGFTTGKKPVLAPSVSLVAAAFAGVWTFSAFPLVSYVVDGLRITNTVVIAAVVLVIVAVVLGVLAPGVVARPQHRRWLRGTSWLAWVLALPAWGFGVFFLDAFLQEQHWNPAVSEAVVVPLIWLACLILPVSALVLRSASAEPPRAFTRWGRLAIAWACILVSALGVMELKRRQAVVAEEHRLRVQADAAKSRLAAPSPAPRQRPLASSVSADTFWEWSRREIQKLEIEKARLSTQLGPKHPTILGIDAQIMRLEDKRTEVVADPAHADEDGLIRLGGRRKLNDRYEVTLDVKVQGAKTSLLPAATLRGYTIRSKYDDGAAAVQTYVPLAMDNEPFVAFWEEERQELWLASPTAVSRHILPVEGTARHEMHFLPDLPLTFRLLIPQAVRRTVEVWETVAATLSATAKTDKPTDYLPTPKPEASPPPRPQPSETALRSFLQRPKTGTTRLIVTLTRSHYFYDDVPEPSRKNCFKLSAGSSHAHAFITDNKALSTKLESLLPWGPGKNLIVTVRWQTGGLFTWLELMAVEDSP